MVDDDIGPDLDPRLMSAYGYKRTFGLAVIHVRFTPESGPFSSLAFMSANDPERTLPRNIGDP